MTKPEFNLLLKLILSLMEKGEHEEVMRLLREACGDSNSKQKSKKTERDV